MMKNSYKLIAYDLCPYVHRVLTLIKYLDIHCDIDYIDLQNKPDWFLKLCPTGKVPTLIVNYNILFESSAINEYLNETTGGGLLPSDPITRAKNRAWTDFGSSLIMQHTSLFNQTTAEDFKAAKDRFNHTLSFVEQEIKEGPLFNGKEFTLIDAAYAPLFLKIEILEKHYPLKLLDNTPKLSRWSQTLLETPCVKQMIPEGFEDKLVARIKSTDNYIGLINK
ncbi:MAG: glutathione S-transferase family protein [Gammaproteobacteria bacterium]